MNCKRIKIIVIVIFFMFSIANAHRFYKETMCKQFLGFQTGYNVNTFNNLSLRLEIKYESKIKNFKRKYLGFALDNTCVLNYYLTNNYNYPLVNSIYANINYLYKVNFWKNRLLRNLNIGTGVISLFNKTFRSYSAALNIGANLNFRISKKCYIILPPFFLLSPFDKATFVLNQNPILGSFPFLNLGLKYKL